ncbi:MAG: DUF58 domain-containing protein [Nitrospirae bacterium]|nr:DUF58 domain-containing protein [Nitrospirota bacterium]
MKVTKEGKKFLLATALIAISALNTGNNLIYLILSMMLSILTVSLVLLKLNLRRIALNISQTSHLFAKEDGIIGVSVTNTKRALPSYSLTLHPPEAIKGRGYVHYVKAGSTLMSDITVQFKKRGIYRLTDFGIESSFPFIFFTNLSMAYSNTEFVVYPEIKRTLTLPLLLSTYGYKGHAPRPGQGEDILFLREFRNGDDTRKISWKASAKADRLMIKEFLVDEPKMISIILDNINPSGGNAFEKAVSFTASISYRLIKEGFLVRLMTCQETTPFGNTEEHLFDILYKLALLKEHDTWQCPISEETGSGGASLLVLKSKGSSMPRYFGDRCDMVIYAE